VDLESIYAWNIGIGGFLGNNLRECGKEEVRERSTKVSTIDIAVSGVFGVVYILASRAEKFDRISA